MDWTSASVELAKPLASSVVKRRDQGGRKVSYIEGWHAIDEANRIFGFDGWTRETVETKMVAQAERKIGKSNPRDGWGVSYIAKVRITAGNIIREGVGAGHGIDTDLGLAHESAIKEAETDAMKRALMTFGNPFGLALYDKEQTNVADDPDASRERKADPAPAAHPPTQSFLSLKASLQKIEDVTSLQTWIDLAKADIATGLLKPSEQATLRSLLEARRAFLAQAPTRDAA